MRTKWSFVAPDPTAGLGQCVKKSWFVIAKVISTRRERLMLGAPSEIGFSRLGRNMSDPCFGSACQSHEI